MSSPSIASSASLPSSGYYQPTSQLSPASVAGGSRGNGDSNKDMIIIGSVVGGAALIGTGTALCFALRRPKDKDSSPKSGSASSSDTQAQNAADATPRRETPARAIQHGAASHAYPASQTSKATVQGATETQKPLAITHIPEDVEDGIRVAEKAISHHQRLLNQFRAIHNDDTIQDKAKEFFEYAGEQANNEQNLEVRELLEKAIPDMKTWKDFNQKTTADELELRLAEMRDELKELKDMLNMAKSIDAKPITLEQKRSEFDAELTKKGIDSEHRDEAVDWHFPLER